MDFENLTPEMMERARQVKDPEELLRLAQEGGYELSDEELEDVSGGGWGCSDYCEKQKCTVVCTSGKSLRPEPSKLM